ncbi:flagellar protein FlgN [Defluviitalea saccharophila]|uniref:Flagellar protein FlgN n=1 Tax=Defluviitalea saccharophila TaxID=879970 RepID=A0ABZ2Y3Z7_9FIRM
MEPNTLIQEMILLGEKKIQLLKQMWELTEKQAQHCTEDQLSELEKLLNERQKCIEEIKELDQRFEEKSRVLKKTLGINLLDEIDLNIYPSARELKKVREDILNHVVRIKSLDDENKKVMEKLLYETSLELKKIRQGKAANQRYQYESAGSGGVYFDTKK